MKGAETGDSGEIGDPDLAVEVSFDVVEHPPQPWKIKTVRGGRLRPSRSRLAIGMDKTGGEGEGDRFRKHPAGGRLVPKLGEKRKAELPDERIGDAVTMMDHPRPDRRATIGIVQRGERMGGQANIEHFRDSRGDMKALRTEALRTKTE